MVQIFKRLVFMMAYGTFQFIYYLHQQTSRISMSSIPFSFAPPFNNQTFDEWLEENGLILPDQYTDTYMTDSRFSTPILEVN